MSGLSVVSRMARRICNLRAARAGAGGTASFGAHSAPARNPEGSREQGVACTPLAGFPPRCTPLAIAALSLFFGIPVLNGCAAGTPPAESGRAPAIDAVLPLDPAGSGLRLFRLGAQRHARVLPDSGGGRATDPQPAESAWLKLAAPAGPFRPVQAVPGQRGYFHLVDAASGRLCLYDADAALLSTFALPAEFVPFRAGRAAVFRGSDGAFTFLDYSSGEAWQFADRQTADAGATGWIPRGRTKLAAGVRSCVQPAGSTELFCTGGDGSALRFDGALNRVAAASGEAESAAQRAAWDPAHSRWRIEGYLPGTPHAAPAGSSRYLFDPESKRWIVSDSL